MPQDENLTPEEKLLRVIQGKDQDSSSSGDIEEVPMVPAEESVPAVPEPAEPSPQPAEMASAQENSAPEEVLVEEPEPEEPPEAEQPELEKAAEPEKSEPEQAAEPKADDANGARPKLRLATASAEGGEASDDKEAVSEEAEKAEPVEKEEKPAAAAVASRASAGAMVAPGMKYEERKTGFGTANRLLTAAVILILALVGFEIWANITAKPIPPPADAGTAEARTIMQSELLPIEEILADVATKPIFYNPSERKGIEDEEKVIKPPLGDYPRKNLRLAGIAELSEEEREAIVMDKGVGKVHFLRVGDTMLANGVEFKITSIESKKVAITDGSGEIWLE